MRDLIMNKAPMDATILHVDDDEANRFAVGRILSRSGYKVVSVESALEGLEQIDQVQPDLIILDIQLPDIDGYEACRRIKNNAQWSSIPVLQMSANFTSSQDKVSGLESGADGYLAQPIDPSVLVATVRSLLRVRRAEQLAKAAIQEAEHATIAKSRFLANMSHEIRTPVAAIMGFLRLLREPKLSSKDTENYLNVIERNSAHLLRLIDDILDVSKVEAGKLLIESIKFSIAELLSDIVSLSRARASENGIDFRLNISTEIPESVVSDPTRIRQILTNMLSNAIKFTSQGSITLDVSYSDGLFTVRVTDTGCGISAEQANRLFKPFEQADISTTRKFGGTGLGLALTRQLSQKLDGTFVLEKSVEGAGSTFAATFMVEPVPGTLMITDIDSVEYSAKTKTADLASQSLNGMKVLLVEDSEDNQELMDIYLKRWGAEVTLAADGQEGLQSAENGDFDIVLMDIQMPKMDGHEATRALRTKGFRKPIVALTAHAMKEEKDRCIESGFTHFLSKPVSMDALHRMLSASH